MDEIFLDVEPREEAGRAKAKALREKGFIPAVVYSGGKEAQAIKVPARSLLKLIHEHHIENAVINLRIKDDKKNKPRPCLIKEIQHDPLHGDIVHVDFNQISLSKAIKVNVPVAVKGEAVGVKQDGGSLEHVLWEIEIECLPTDIPKEIEVDIANLKIGDAVHIKDIKFASGIKPLVEPDATVLHVVAPMKEEAPAAEEVTGEEKKEPEVIKEKKEVPAEAEAKESKEAKEKK